jgi:patatin-related protein
MTEEAPEPVGEEPPEEELVEEEEAEEDSGDGAGAAAAGDVELRLALAMRGGVSLAVWIGGAIAELDLARRGMRGDQGWPVGSEAERERAEAYAELLRNLGYTDLVIDVLAGASAGGLNAVIYGFAQSVGTDLEWLREVWRGQGDLWGLFHEQWDSTRPYRTEAVFDADKFFYGKVREQLLKQAEHARPELTSDYLTVDLAATLQAAPPLPDLRTGADLRPRTGHFRFRRTPASPGTFNDMPATDEDTEAVSGLAYAARATSSFPGAFEPAGVFSWEPQGPDTKRRDREEGDDTPENLAAVFSEVALTPASTYDVMDGGVFDNIPIGRAIQAIADAPASRPTERILIYLDPSPPHAGRARAAPPAFEKGRRQMRAKFVRSALTALRYKQTVESASDDLRALNRLRSAVADLQTRRRLFLDVLPGVLTQGVEGQPLDARYRQIRAQVDAARLCTLLTAPGAGFLRALVPSPPVATALGVTDADVVQAALRKQLAERTAYACERDAVALVAASDLFISWLRRHQASSTGPADALAAAKLAVYRARTYALYLSQRRERDAVVRALGTATPPELDTTTVIDAEAVADALWPDALAGSTPPVAGDLSSEAGLWATLGRAESASTGQLVTWVDAGWQALGDAITGLPDCDAKRIILHKSGIPREQTTLTPTAAQRLQMSASVALGELGATAVPDFFTFSGDQTPLTSDHLHNVVRQGRAQAIDADLAARREPQPISAEQAMNAGSKLAGNQLANFAGFLSADWRTHDWRWGRLDAGAALLSTLHELHPATDPAVFDRVETLLCQSYGELDRRKLTLADVPPGRRFALGARLGLGLQRSMWPLTPRNRDPQGFRLRDIPSVVALIVLRPLLVLLPLLLRPPVLVGVVVVVAGAQHWMRETTHQPSGVARATFTALTALALALLATRVISLVLARRHWKRLVDAPGDEFRSAVIRLMARRAVTGLVVAAVLVILLVARLTGWSFWSWVHDGMARATGFEAFVVLGALVAGNLAVSKIGATSVVRAEQPAPRDKDGWASAAILIAITFGLAWLASLTYADGAASGARVATSVAVGGVVWAVHHAWARMWWPEAMAGLSGLATAWLLLDKPQLGFGPHGRFFGSSWTSSGWGPILDVAILVVVVTLAFGAGLLSRWLTDLWGDLGQMLSLVLLLLVALWGAWQLTLAWHWLVSVPVALVYGSAIAAATTLFVPFRPQLE